MKTLRGIFVALVVAGAALGADAELLKFVGADARMVAGVNLAQCRSTPFGRFLLSQLKAESKEFQDFIAATQFDPRRDLTELVAASGTHNDSIVAVRGTFQVAALAGMIQSKGGKPESYAGATLFVPGTAQGEPPHAIAFVGNMIAVAGPLDQVKAALDRRRNIVRMDRQMAARVAELSRTEDAWAVSIVPLTEMAAHVPDANVSGAMKGGAMQSIQQVSGGLRFGPTVKVTMEALTRSDKDATALADVVRFLVGLVVLNRPAGHADGLAAAVEKMDLRAEGSTARLSIEIPEAQLEQIFEHHPRPAHIRTTAAHH